MQITIEQAKALCAVVDYGGYSKASERLHKSHTSLIYLIKNFEAQCGFALFDRNQYKNTLTTEGKAVYLKSIELIEKAHELQNLCEQYNSNWEPNIKIIFDGILSITPFIDIYSQFKKNNIPTQIQTHIEYLQGVENTFLNQDADIMISLLQTKQKDLEVEYLNSLNIYLVAHKEHAIHKTTKKWKTKDLKEFNFLTVRNTQEDLKLNTEDLEKTASFFLSDFSFKKEAIMKKIGFGWLPEHMIANELKNKTLQVVKWERDNMQALKPRLYYKAKNRQGRSTKMILEIIKSQ